MIRASFKKALIGLALFAFGAAPIVPAHADNIAQADVLVRLQPGTDVSKFVSDYRTNVLEHVSDTALYSLRVPDGSTPASFAQALSADARVVYAEPDSAVGSPEFWGKMRHFAFDKGPDPGLYINQAVYQQVDLGNALRVSTGAGVIVAVLDTGATFTHPALSTHYIIGYNAIAPGTEPADLPDGLLNVAVGHGTMVAGIIARIAPGAKIMPVRVLDGDGVGTMYDVAQGIHWAVTHGAKVINMSFSASQLTSVMKDALDEAKLAGVVLVGAAGNDGVNEVQFPAAQGIAVASVESDNTKSDYSNYGSFVRVVAPGSGICSTYWTGGYATWSGTSFAAPFVAGEAALLLAVNPSADNVGSIIRNTSRSVENKNPLYRSMLGNGLIDINAAVGKRH